MSTGKSQTIFDDEDFTCTTHFRYIGYRLYIKTMMMNIKMQNNEEEKKDEDFYYANLIKKYCRKMPIENDVVDKKK